ncbi:MAG: MATE family efflux transporter, partial [Muribaculaceae bacterium]|nr:MATE family efflux transporter [Muribaculaceae bacterium]
MNREILRLSIPAIISNITVPILGLSDTTISGHLGSEIYIGAIAVGTMMFNVIFWLFGFLRMGTTGLTAQAYGAGDNESCRQLLVRSSMLGVIIGVTIILLHYPLRELLLLLISP